MSTKWYSGTVVEVVDFSKSIKQLFIKIDHPEKFEFEAGQFITLDLPIHQNRLNRWRSYSICNLPNKENIIELCIVKLERGLASEYFFERVIVGTVLKLKGPGGGFVLPQKVENKLVFICTGTGVAPFRSMILSLYSRRSQNDVHLIFGTRTREELLYYDEFGKLAKSNSGFKYSVVLSRDNWDGPRGYVHDLYMKEYTGNADNTDFYLCGWSDMVDEAVSNLLLKLKVKKENIHYELFG